MIKLFNKISLISIILAIASQPLMSQKWVELMQDSSATLEQQSQAFDSYWKTHNIERGKGFVQFKRVEYLKRNAANQNNASKENILQSYKALQNSMNSTKSFGSAGKWTQIGPFGPVRGSGRINCIDFHPTSNLILAGSPSGGIWRSTDDGATWYTNTDNLSALGISDIKFAPSDGDIVYAATGDPNGDYTYSIGVLKSIDGGLTWNQTNLSQIYSNQKQTYKILVDPNNPDIVYASTDIGLFKTIDGGQTWVRKKMGSFRNMVFKPNDPNTIYAVLGTSIIQKSIDAGQTFTTLTSFSQISASTSRLELAVTPADPNYLYVLSGNNSDNGLGGVYLSTDAGSTFTTQATTPNLLGWRADGTDAGGQAWYDLSIAVSPTNKNLVFVGGVNSWKSVDAGKNWALNTQWQGQNAPYIHADKHIIKFNPYKPNNIWLGSDGGVGVSNDNGITWTEKNNGLSIAQMYRLGSSKTSSDIILTGWQDNGTSLLKGTIWSSEIGGDGMECIVAHNNNNIMYGETYYGKIQRSLDGGNSWYSIVNNITEQGDWVTPYVMDATNANLLYAGFVNVWKTLNGGTTWTKISNFATTKTIISLASAPSNSNVIWAANSTTTYKTTDGGTNWTTITIPGAPSGAQVNYFAIDQTNPDLVWVCLSGFFDGQKVYETKDGGATWTNISGNLPNYPANCIITAQDTNLGLYLGTDMGIYYRDSTLADWVPFSKDLPNVIVKELELFSQGKKIRAATFGRGLWESDIYPLANAIKKSNPNKNLNVELYPNPTKDIVYVNVINEEKKQSELTIYDNNGKLLQTKKIINNNETRIDISKYSAGIYLFKVTSGKSYYEGKVVIK